MAPQREQAASHMDFVDLSDGLVQRVMKSFDECIAVFSSQGLLSRLALDPCFGFSKSYQQNWELMEKVPELLSYYQGLPFLIGISRKSFLKQYLEKRSIEPTLEKRDQLQLELIRKIKKKMSSPREFWVRTHQIFNSP